MSRIKIAVLGVGQHSVLNHLPSLKMFNEQRPGEIELAGICDIRFDAAKAAAGEYGFAGAYDDFDAMLDGAKPDAVIAVTPISITRDVARNVVDRGLPLLMEKPLGANLDESRDIVEFCEGRKVMVSLNRRYHPAVVAAKEYLSDRKLEYIRATMLRVNRTEPDFIFGTAIHAVDVVRSIAGDVKEYHANVKLVDGVRWYTIDFVFTSGAKGRIEVFPSAGVHGESYEAAGAGYCLRAQASELSAGRIVCSSEGKTDVDEILNVDEPLFVRNGSYSETVSFIEAVEGKGEYYPTPVQAIESAEICQEILDQADLKS